MLLELFRQITGLSCQPRAEHAADTREAKPGHSVSGTGYVGQAAVGVSGRGGFNHTVDCEWHFGRSGSQHGSQEKSALKIDNLAIIKLRVTQNALTVHVAQPKFTVS